MQRTSFAATRSRHDSSGFESSSLRESALSDSASLVRSSAPRVSFGRSLDPSAFEASTLAHAAVAVMAAELDTRLRLLLAQAVHQEGSNWPRVAELLDSHPLCSTQPAGFFTEEVRRSR